MDIQTTLNEVSTRSNRERRRQNRKGIDYHVLKGKAIDKQMASSENPHFQVHIISGEGRSDHHRIAINVRSQDNSEVLYFLHEDFQHEMLAELPKLKEGFTRVEASSTIALDYIRGNLFDIRDMTPLPMNKPGADNDLNDKIDKYITKAMKEDGAVVYAFGDIWGPEEKRDKIFHFSPGSGIHDIHMNQGNYAKKFWDDNGIFHDGALFLQFPSEERWVALFLAFQSQSTKTDDKGFPEDLNRG